MIIQVTNPESAIEWVYFIVTILGSLGGAGTLILAILYLFQHRTLEEQTKISKLNQTPYLTGPYRFQYNSNTEKYEMYITNAGKGVAENIEMKTKLRIVGVNSGNSFTITSRGLGGADDREEYEDLEIKGGEGSAKISRAETHFLDIDAVQPRESEVLFQIDPNMISLGIIDCTETPPEEDMYSPSEVFPALKKMSVDIIQIHTEIVYSDRFGNSKDPFGREYKLYGPNPTLSTHTPEPELSLAPPS